MDNTTAIKHDRTKAIARMNKQFVEMGGEEGRTDLIGGAFYFFGSELATLRIFRKFNLKGHAKNVRQGESANMSSFYIAVETDMEFA